MLQLDAFKSGLVFFAFHLFIVGYVIIKSEDYILKVIGIFLIAASAGYAIDSFAYFLLPNYAALFLLIVALPDIIGELYLAFWLLFKGVKQKETMEISLPVKV